MADARRCRDNFARYLERLVPARQLELARDLYAQALAEAQAEALAEARDKMIEAVAQQAAAAQAAPLTVLIRPQTREEADRWREHKTQIHGVGGAEFIRYGCGCRDLYEGPHVEVRPCSWHAAPVEAAP